MSYFKLKNLKNFLQIQLSRLIACSFSNRTSPSSSYPSPLFVPFLSPSPSFLSFSLFFLPVFSLSISLSLLPIPPSLLLNSFFHLLLSPPFPHLTLFISFFLPILLSFSSSNPPPSLLLNFLFSSSPLLSPPFPHLALFISCSPYASTNASHLTTTFLLFS